MTGSDLDIPDANGWAKSPARVVADPAWRRREKPRFRWLAWLGGLAAVSLIGAGALLLLGGEPAAPGEVPLITADPSPVRIRPDDPGGMQVPNLDKRVYDQLARGNQATQRPSQRVESLLPPPEAPRPVPLPPPSLPAQQAALTDGPTEAERAREPEQPAAPPAQASAPPVTAAAPPPAPPRPAASAPPPPAPSQVAAASVPPPPPTPAPTPTQAGRIQVQLAAVPSEQAATAEWNRLRRRMPELLGNQNLVVSRGEREGQPFWRVRTGAFEDNASARAFCERVKAAGGSCFVAPSG